MPFNTELWAVKNDCNGVFHCSASLSKADAEAKVESYGSGAYVVPVLLLDLSGKPMPYERERLKEIFRHGPTEWSWGF